MWFKINVSQESKIRRKTDPVHICQQATTQSMHPNFNRKKQSQPPLVIEYFVTLLKGNMAPVV